MCFITVKFLFSIAQVNLSNLNFIPKNLYDFTNYFYPFLKLNHFKILNFEIEKLVELKYFRYIMQAIILIIEFEVKFRISAHRTDLLNYGFEFQNSNSKYFTIELFIAGLLK